MLRSANKPKTFPAREVDRSMTMTEKLIISMVTSGMSFNDILQAFPDLTEQQLRKLIAPAVARINVFAD